MTSHPYHPFIHRFAARRYKRTLDQYPTFTNLFDVYTRAPLYEHRVEIRNEGAHYSTAFDLMLPFEAVEDWLSENATGGFDSCLTPPPERNFIISFETLIDAIAFKLSGVCECD